MKKTIIELLNQTVTQLKSSGHIPEEMSVSVQLQHSKKKEHGDFATNLALMLAKPMQKNPRDIAQLICQSLPENQIISKTEIAGAGFINFFVNEENQYSVIHDIMQQRTQYGVGNLGAGQKVLIEFVSANPTGPLHVGHGRGAAYGACLADLLAAAGYEVEREYYVNDAGRQMDILATSVYLRYLELCGVEFEFPDVAYQGDYICDIAQSLRQQHSDKLKANNNLVAPPNSTITSDEYLDLLIDHVKQTLSKDYEIVLRAALNNIKDDIAEDLAEFGVHYQTWFSEKSLVDDGAVPKVITALVDSGHTYEKEGALWFKSTAFGDDKDRVLKRENGQTTYFASDVAYHINKFMRGYDQIINIWGADHHGYVPRVKAALKALGCDAEKLMVKLVQFASLTRAGERVSMSTRKADYVTLRDLRNEVGNDATRFYYVTRKPEQHIDFDLDLAVSQEKDNIVYYIQYAHARVCRVFERLKEKSQDWNIDEGLNHLAELKTEKEKSLIGFLGRYPEIISSAAKNLEPHLLTHYLRELAGLFHSYYDVREQKYRVLVEDDGVRNARLTLSVAVQQVIANGLKILGVSAPEKM